MQPSYRVLLWSLALTGFALDQTSKYVVFASLERAPGYSREVIPRAFELVATRVRNDTGKAVLYVNQGAFFGGLQWWGTRANAGFAVVNLVFALTIAFLSACRAAVADRALCVGLGLILAGTLGNLYDRLLFGGVRDFLLWYLAGGGLVFNIADCCLALGTGRLLLQVLRSQLPSDDNSSVRLLTPTAGVDAED